MIALLFGNTHYNFTTSVRIYRASFLFLKRILSSEMWLSLIVKSCAVTLVYENNLWHNNFTYYLEISREIW